MCNNLHDKRERERGGGVAGVTTFMTKGRGNGENRSVTTFLTKGSGNEGCKYDNVHGIEEGNLAVTKFMTKEGCDEFRHSGEGDRG
jgi:hypothetical protein